VFDVECWWDKHFHEPGGIHLNLPLLSTYNYTGATTACQVLFASILKGLGGATIIAIEKSRQKCGELEMLYGVLKIVRVG